MGVRPRKLEALPPFVLVALAGPTLSVGFQVLGRDLTYFAASWEKCRQTASSSTGRCTARSPLPHPMILGSVVGMLGLRLHPTLGPSLRAFWCSECCTRWCWPSRSPTAPPSKFGYFAVFECSKSTTAWRATSSRILLPRVSECSGSSALYRTTAGTTPRAAAALVRRSEGKRQAAGSRFPSSAHDAGWNLASFALHGPGRRHGLCRGGAHGRVGTVRVDGEAQQLDLPFCWP